jgi:hypothetical protein
MTDRIARIDSYFSLPTDLAEGMRAWREFVSGEGYSVELRSPQELVTVSLQDGSADDAQHVIVKSTGDGALFAQVLGNVVYALAAHSDNVQVSRWTADET